MKQLSMLGILLCLFAGGSHAATVSGLVSSAATCGPLSGHKVYIVDSLGVWIDSTVTNSFGAYSFTVPAGISNPNTLMLSATGCGVKVSRGLLYHGRSIRQNLILCGTNMMYIGVNVMYRNPGLGYTGVSQPYVVYLIRRDVDPLTLDTTLTAIDSNYTANLWTGYSYFEVPCMAMGKFMVKAALQPTHPDYASYLPTYHDSALNWSNADTLSVPQRQTGAYVNVYMVKGTNPGGPGFIGGSVLVGANKTTAVGDPLSSRILILTDAASGKAVAYTHSDAAGKFSFPSVPYGNYKIFGDAGGKTNPALSLSLTATNKRIDNIVFEENNKTFKGHLRTTGIGGASQLAGISVFPNPVTDVAGIRGLSAISGSKTIVLSTMAGAVISRTVTTDDAAISTASLPAGIYLLEVRTDNGNASFRIAK